MKSLKEKYSQLSPVVKASFWFVICNVIQKSTQIVTTPIYTNILTKSEYGEYTTFLSWIELFSVLMTLNVFYGCYSVGMERFNNDRDLFTASMHGFCLTVTSCCSAILIPLFSIVHKKLNIPYEQLIALIIYMYIYPVFQFWSARKRYEYKYIPLIIVTTLLSILSIGLGTLFAWFYPDKNNGLIIAKLLVEGLISLPLLIISVKRFKYLLNIHYWSFALRFCVPLIPHYLSSMVLNHSDRLMIKEICGSADAAVYSVAYSIAMLMTIVQSAVNGAITPWMFGKIRNRSFSKMTTMTSTVIILFGALNFVVILLAPEAVMLLSSRDYLEACYVIPPVVLGVFSISIYGFFMNVEFYFGFNKYSAFSSVCAAVLNIILNMIFIEKYGFLAAGYTTLVSYLFLVILHYCGLKIICKRNEINYKNIFSLKVILLTIIIMYLLTVLATYLYTWLILRVLLIVGLAMVLFMQKNRILNVAKFILNQNK